MTAPVTAPVIEPPAAGGGCASSPASRIWRSSPGFFRTSSARPSSGSSPRCRSEHGRRLRSRSCFESAARDAVSKVKTDNEDQAAGVKIVVRALEQPMREIARNAGDEPSVVINKVSEGKGNFGYNA